MGRDPNIFTNEKRALSRTRFRLSGEGGRPSSIGALGSILRLPGTPGKEALLIITFRLGLKMDLDSM